MAKIDNGAARVYSTDKNLWLGMTRENAYKAGEKVLKLFNYADKDGDKILSQKELNRYNSPVVIENYEEVSNSRIVTQGQVKYNSLVFPDGAISLTSNVITNKEEEFYAGLELKDVSTKGSEIFYSIDTNRDGKISNSEIKVVAEIKSRLNKALKQVQNAFVQYGKKGNQGIKWGAGIGGVGVAAAVGGSMFLGAEEGAAIGALGGGLAGALVGAFVGGCVGIGMAYFGGKSLEKEANYEKIFNEAMGNLKSHLYVKHAKETFIKGVKDMAAKYFE